MDGLSRKLGVHPIRSAGFFPQLDDDPVACYNGAALLRQGPLALLAMPKQSGHPGQRILHGMPRAIVVSREETWHYLHKPFSLDRLLGLVHRYVPTAPGNGGSLSARA